jgi:branched-chain amino acid aminotransferase
VSDDRREEILAAPGFGRYFTDHMVTIRWTSDRGWHAPRVEPYGPLSLDPASMVLHYGQEIFEGLKAYAQPDGSVAAFRPERNASRFRKSAARLAMPELPEKLFLESLRQLCAADRSWVPSPGGEDSLYLRPFLIATEVGLGVKPASEYLYLLIASPAGPYFPGGPESIDVWLCTDFVRAAQGGTGMAKCGGNYAGVLLAQAQANAHGCAQVAYLDAAERTWVEELGGMNLFFVLSGRATPQLVTPELSGTILSGVVRDSLLTLASDAGYQVQERRISATEWLNGCQTGEITEVFACGTAAVITPVGRVMHAGGTVAVSGGRPGPVTGRLRTALTEIQQGRRADTHSWMTRL